MSNPLQTVSDGFTAIITHWQTVLGALSIVAISQYLLVQALNRIFEDKLDAREYYSLALAGWLLPASLISLLWYFFSRIISSTAGLMIVIILIVPVIFLLLRSKKNSFRYPPVILLILTLLFIILRMAFVAKAILPLYFDSASHYQFIKDVSASLEHFAPSWPLINYYHLGFHILVAFLNHAMPLEINDSMLVLGQIILAVMPFSVFFIVSHWTRSKSAGIFAFLLAGVGWFMPAHAVDWGKYPALAGVALIPFVLSIAHLAMENKKVPTTNQLVGLSIVLLPGIASSIFFHSRVSIVYIIWGLTWVITSFWGRLRRLPQLIALGIMIPAVTAAILSIRGHEILFPLFNAYGMDGIWITLLVLFLSLPAYRTYPRVVFACIISISLLLLSLFVPVGSLIPGYQNMTLLDRPFVQMIVYLPLTLMGGFGLAGLERYLREKSPSWGTGQWAVSKPVSLFFIGVVIVNALVKYDLYPSDCCELASQDDLTAIQWMDENLPQDARILISSTELKVLPTEEHQGYAGGDAGIWINPLINRTTILMPFNTDLSQQQTVDILCQLQIDYVYVGKTEASFNDAGMPSQPDTYKVFFVLPNVHIYEVTGCKTTSP